MSIRAGGIYNLNNQNMSTQDEISISFQLVRLSTDFKVGLLLGANSSFDSSSNTENAYKQIAFNLTDDPLDINAECLLIGDGIEITVGSMRLDSAESLASRMQRLQGFFESAFAIESIMSFELSINIDQGDSFETVPISVKDFKNKMLKLYEREDNWTPVIKLIITSIVHAN